MKGALRRKFPHVYREIRRSHHRGYDLLDVATGQAGTKKMDMRMRIEKGGKKGKADEVVAMSVGNKQRDVERAVHALQKLAAETNNAAPCIKDESMIANLHFDAR